MQETIGLQFAPIKPEGLEVCATTGACVADAEARFRADFICQRPSG